jgi:hypothetical protein
MSDGNREQRPREIEELTTAIREMASRVSAQFVLDDRKAQNFIAAGEQRDHLKKVV